jgi:hypothetical protein
VFAKAASALATLQSKPSPPEGGRGMGEGGVRVVERVLHHPRPPHPTLSPIRGGEGLYGAGGEGFSERGGKGFSERGEEALG